MKFIIAYAIFLLSLAPIFAASETVTLDMNLNIDNKIITRPSVAVGYGKTARLSQSLEKNSDHLVIEITPTQDTLDADKILLALKIEKLHDGVPTMISSRQIHAKAGKTAKITQNAYAQDSFKSFDLEILAK